MSRRTQRRSSATRSVMYARFPRCAEPGKTWSRGLKRSAWHASPLPSPSESRWPGFAVPGQLSRKSGTPSLSRSPGFTAVKLHVGLYTTPAEVETPTRQYQTLPKGGLQTRCGVVDVQQLTFVDEQYWL